MNDEKIIYAIIRCIPEPLRGEQLNIGIVAVYNNELLVRVPGEPTRAMRAMMSSSQIDAALSLDVTMPIQAVDGKYDIQTCIDHWREFGFMSSFVLTAPQKRLIPEASEISASFAVDSLFTRLVMPRGEPVNRVVDHSRGLKSIVSNIAADYKRATVQRNVRIQLGATQPSLDFDIALANGKLFLGQIVNLATKRETREKHYYHAIANAADLRVQLGAEKSREIDTISIVGVDENGDNAGLIEHLEKYGAVFKFPEQREDFSRFLRNKAEREVSTKFNELGFETLDEGSAFKAVLSGDGSRIEGGSPQLQLQAR